MIAINKHDPELKVRATSITKKTFKGKVISDCKNWKKNEYSSNWNTYDFYAEFTTVHRLITGIRNAIGRL